PSPPAASTLSLHDALPISELCAADVEYAPNPFLLRRRPDRRQVGENIHLRLAERLAQPRDQRRVIHAGHGADIDAKRRRIGDHVDRKSTRLNSSHLVISYA